MLIILHICLFLMSYDNVYTSLGDSETIILYNHIQRSPLRDVIPSLGKFDFQLNYSSDGSYIGHYNQSFSALIMQYSISCFWYLKVPQPFSGFMGQLGIYIFTSAQYYCQWTSLNFHNIPDGFRCLPGGKFTRRFNPRKCLKIWHFSPWSEHSWSAYWDRMNWEGEQSSMAY